MLLMVLQLPVTIILALTVPVVDYDEEDHKWNKWLNCLHCLMAPLTMVLLIKVKAGQGEVLWRDGTAEGLLRAHMYTCTQLLLPPPPPSCSGSAADWQCAPSVDSDSGRWHSNSNFRGTDLQE